jgi:hypothetical protein
MAEKTQPIIDFKELAAYSAGHGLEALARQLGHSMGLKPEWTGVGPDDGKDLIFSEIQLGKLSDDRIKWLVQCKDKSESGDCVTDLGPNFSISDKCNFSR